MPAARAVGSGSAAARRRIRSAIARTGSVTIGTNRGSYFNAPSDPRVISTRNSLSLTAAVTSPNGVVSHRLSVCDQTV